MNYSISFTEEAKQDLRSISHYITFTLNSPMAAKNLLDKIQVWELHSQLDEIG